MSADLNPLTNESLLAAPALQGAEFRALADDGSAVTRTAVSAVQATTEIVFVDPRVPDRAQLLAGLTAQSDGRRFEVIELDPRRDGVAQVSEALRGRVQIDAVHFITHGAEGAVQLGGTWLDAKALAANADAIAGWGDSLKQDADLLFYGCDLASSASGRALMGWIAELTRGDVAASDDPSGAAAQGGDWELEASVGAIETRVAIAEEARAAWAHVLGGVPVGGEAAANTPSAELQETPTVATAPDGRYVIAWASNNQDGNGMGVFARVYDANGNAASGEIQVNTTALGNQVDPTVAMDAAGNFVVAWSGNGTGGDGADVFFRRFSAAGAALGGEALVNNAIPGNQSKPDIAMETNGDFAIVWQSDESGTTEVWMRRFGAGGTPLAAATLVSVNGGNNDSAPGIAMDDDGDFVVAWESLDASNGGVFARRYDNTGAAVGGQVQVNATFTNNQGAPDVAMDADGDYLVVWEGWSATDGQGIYGQRFTAAGALQGTEFRANTQTAPNQTRPSVSMAADGRAVVTWESQNQLPDNSGIGIFRQEYTVAGAPDGVETVVNTYTNADQKDPVVAMDDNGGYVVAWSGAGTGDSNGVFWQRYAAPVTGTISGTVYHDVDGDGNLAGASTFSGATVRLYRDDGDGAIGAGDTLYASAVTGPTGAYAFSGVTLDTYYVVVDSRTLGAANVWAEQTYAAANAASATAPGGFTASAGTLFGGRNAAVSDLVNAANPVGAEHVIKVALAGAGGAGNVDFGFSFNAVTTSRDADDDPSPERSVQGSLRQFIQNANAISNAAYGIQSANFSIGGGGLQTINLAAALPGITEAVVIDGGTQDVYAGLPLIELNGASAGATSGLMLQSGSGGSTIRALAINRFTGKGIDIAVGSDGNSILANHIGTNAAGTATLGNTAEGIAVASRNNTIGGNVISGNFVGVLISGSGATGNRIEGNSIGTDLAGAVDLGNISDGVRIASGASGNTVGGTASGAGNLISGNNNDGIEINAASNNVVQGNRIGTNAAGTLALGNSVAGVNIAGGATNNTVGGTAPDAGNTIAFNSQDGVQVNGATTTGNAILGNAIRQNTQLGIDLVAAGDLAPGVTAYDGAFDIDTGANGLQNTLQLYAAGINGGNLTVHFAFASTANSTFRVEFFASAAPDASGYGEGQRYLGFATVGTDGSGNATVNNLTLPFAVAAGEYISVTVTDAANNTSEFSNAVMAANRTLSGAVYNDLNADALVSGAEGTFSNARVDLYLDDGDSAIDAGDLFVGTTFTGAGGAYSFTGLGSSTYYVVVDSATLGGPPLWAEQTYGAFEAASGAGFTAGGPLYGGRERLGAGTSDDASSLATAEHVIRRSVTGADAVGVDFGFSFSAITTARDGDDTLDARTVQGSLRQFIQNANAIPNAMYGIQSANFQIGAPGSSQVINVNGAPLPTITDAVVLDAWTQGPAGYNGPPLVTLNGAAAGGGANGLSITGGGSTIRGFVIRDFEGHGVAIAGGGGNTVANNYIGTDATGMLDRGNGLSGVFIDNSTGNTIGGATPAQGNVISANARDGVSISGPGSTGNVVAGNLIGLNAAGDAALANGEAGIDIDSGASNNTVGAIGVTASNVISGNLHNGIEIEDAGTTGNVVVGNYIGLSATGDSAIGNARSGVAVTGADGNTIGGAVAGAGNVISGNVWDGIALVSANGNVVLSNYVGTDWTGSFAVANREDGIYVLDGANNVIGGAGGAGNLLSGNLWHGVDLRGAATDNLVQGNYVGVNAAGNAALANGISGVMLNGASGNTIGGAGGAGNVLSGNLQDGITGFGANDNRIQGNFIGTDATGSFAIANREDGIYFEDSSNNTIGGGAPGAGNLISGNQWTGITLWGTGSGNRVQGNYIGTNAAGNGPIGNAEAGVYLSITGPTTVGGTVAGEGNRIAYNGWDGVAIMAGTGHSVLGNVIYANAEQAIDIEDDGITANDAGDLDAGPNERQNFPLLYGAAISGPTVTVSGTLEGASGTNYRIEFFADGVGGPRYLGATTLFIGAAGSATFAHGIATSVTAGETITATATNLTTGSTSELSAAVIASAGFEISGTLFHDVNGNANVTDDGAGAVFASAANAVALYLDDGDGIIDSGDSFVSAVSTNASGGYSFGGLASGTYYVVVNSRALGATTYVSGFGLSDVWAEQTYGTAGSALGAGFTLTPGALYGGRNVAQSDNAPGSINTAEHVTRVTLAGGNVGNVNSGFSFNAIVNTRGNNVDDDTSNARRQQGTLRQFILNSNAIDGVQAANFSINYPAGGAATITVSGAALPTITRPVILDATTQEGAFAAGAPRIALAGSIGFDGLAITGGGSTVRGFAINGFDRAIYLSGSGGNTISGNYLGTNLTGNTGIGNQYGVWAESSSNLIGGTTAADRNVISGNSIDGVVLRGSNNTVAGNYIGTDSTGTFAIGNGEDGVWLYGGSGNTVGGDTSGARNIIAANGWAGVAASNLGADHVIQGNWIGLNAGGAALGNAEEGVRIYDGVDVTVGGTAAGAGNVIAHNGTAGPNYAGVTVDSGSGHSILGNSIYANTGLGIDLDGDGPTLNDAPDGDGHQNFPVLTAAATTAGTITISGTLNSTPSSTFRLEFFANPMPGDASGYGEGERYLGAMSVSTDSAGNASFTSPAFTATVALGERITATATDLASGDTSEFSAQIAAALPNAAPVASDVSASGNEDAAQIAITLVGSDVEGPVASFRLASLPSNGALFTDAGLTTAAAVGTNYPAASNVLTLYFRPNLHWNGTTTFQFTATDAGGLDDATPAIATITVAAQNDAPVNTVPVSIAVTEDVATPITGISIADIDVGAGALVVTLSVPSGTLAASAAGGVAVAGSGTGTLTLAGTLSDLNAFLATPSVSFTTAPNATAPVMLTVTTNDQGNTGAPGAQTDSDTITLNVTPVNDAPEGADAIVVIPEDTAYAFGLADFGFADPGDAPSNGLAAVRIVSLPVAGTLTRNAAAVGAGDFIPVADISAGLLVFTPAAGASGAPYASFAFQVQDNGGIAGGGVDLDPTPNTITIEVTGLNDAPVVVVSGGAVTYTENDPATPVDSALTVTDSDNPTLAGATVRIVGGFAAGEDVLSFTAAGGITGAWNGVTGTLTLNGPASLADWQTVLRSVAYLNTSEDPVAAARTIEFVVHDGAANSAPVARTVNVLAVNDAPVAANANVNGTEDDPVIAFTLTASDVDDTIASFRILGALPANGTLYTNAGLTTLAAAGVDMPASGNAVTLYFVPAANWNGTTGFQFDARDATGADSTPATATIVVDAANDAPVANNVSAAGSEDAPSIAITLSASDVDDAIASFRLAGLPANGVLYTNAGLTVAAAAGIDYAAAGNVLTLYFVPATDWNGSTGFQFTARDAGGLDSAAPASATIDVAPVNDAPVANNVTVNGLEDAASIAITLTGSDVDDAIASFRILGALPANGALYTNAGLATLAVAGTDIPASGNALTLYFVPAANWSGSTGFQFTATDAGALVSPAPATATINVLAANDPPVAADATANGNEDDASIAITLTGTDTEGPVASFRLAALPANGLLYLDAGLTTVAAAGTDYAAAGNALTLYFVPAANWSGGTGFQFTAVDGVGLADGTPATATITVAPVNDDPVAIDVLANGAEDDASIAITLAGSDVDGAIATFRLAGLPANGALYTDAGLTNAAVAGFDYAAAANALTLYFVPAANWNGTTSFQYTATDGGGLSDATPATATINVAAVNDSPAAIADAAATDQDTPVTTGDVLANDALGDLPSTIVAFDAVSAQGGTVVAGAGNTFVYTPATAFSGTDTFTYTLRDADGETSTATVTVTVANLANDPPVNIVPGTQLSAEDVALVFSSGNGNRIAVSDPDAGASPLEVTLAATNGALTLSGTAGLTFSVGTGTGDATMTFTGTIADINAALDGMSFLPPLNFTGAASVTITTGDLGASGAGGPLSDSDTVNITVNPIDDAPTLDLDADNSSGAAGADYARSFTENGGSRLVADADAVLADADSINLASLIVTLTNPLDGAAESLSANTTGTLITASYNAGTGVLTLNGADTVANYQTVLRTVRYDNASEAPSTSAARVITFVASDGASASNVGTASVTVIAVNDDPVATITAASYTATENVALDLHGTGMAVSDIDALATSVVTVYLDSISGLLSATAGTTGVTIAGSGSPSLSFTGTLAQINTLLAGGGGATVAYLVGSDSPAPTDTLSLAINDMGATGTGGARWSWDSVTVNLIAVNDAPLITIPGTATTAEDTPLVFSAGAGNQISITDVDAAGTPVEVALSVTNGTLNVAGAAGLTFVAGANGTAAMTFTGTVAAINAALDGLAFTPSTDYSGPAFLSLTVNDLGASGLGGPLVDSDFASITVTPANDAPDGADATVTTPQDTPYVFGVANFGFTDGDAGDTLAAVRIDALPAAGSVTLSGGAVSAGQVIAVADIAAGNLVFTPAPGGTGVPYASFTFSVQDSGGAFDASPNTLTVNVATLVNNPPAGTNGTATTSVGTDYVFTLADFGYSDPDVGDAFAALRIDTLPSPLVGTLYFGALALVPGVHEGTVVSAGLGGIASGNLYFRPVPLLPGTASFDFSVRDTNGPAFDAAPNTMTVNVVVPTNDPVNVVPLAQTVNEDTPTAIAGVAVNDPNGDLASVQLGVANGTLNATAAGAATVSGAGSAALTISGSQVDINATLATLSYLGNPNYAGADTLTITSTDATLLADTDTVAITVNPVNDAPVATAPASYTATEQVPLALAGLAVGDLDSGAANVTVTLSAVTGAILVGGGAGVTVSGSGTPLVTLTGSVGSINAVLAGAVNYLVTTDSPPATDTLTLTIDDGGASGAGGPRSASVTSTITLSAANDAPVNTLPGGATTLEDTPFVYSAALGNRISITDVDAGGSTVQVSLAGSNGVVTLGGTAGLLFSVGDGAADANMTFTGTVAAINAALDGLVFTPNPDYNGLAFISMTTNDLGASGAGGALSDTDLATIDALPVNDAPNGTDTTVTVNEDASYVFGAGNFGFNDVDLGDAMTEVRIDSISLPAGATLTLGGVPVVPGTVIPFAGIGTLVFTPVADANGAGYASFTFSVKDTGVPPGPLFDPVPNTMTINVAPVNDLPVITSHGGLAAVPLTVVENTTGVTTVTATDIDGQPLAFAIAGGLDAARFAIDAATGVLTFNPAPNYEAPADSGPNNVYDVVVRVDDGAGGSDTQTFAITVTDGNDAPFVTGDAYVAVEDNALSIAAPAGTLANDGDEDGNPITAALVAGPANGAVALNADGSFVYTPNANFAGVDSFTYRVSDGAAISADATVTISVTPVNDAPTAANGAVLSAPAIAYAFALADFGFSDVDGDALDHVQITALPTLGALTVGGAAVALNQIVTAAEIASGSLQYLAPTGTSAADTFGFVVHDGTVYAAAANTMTIGFILPPATPAPPAPPPVDTTPPPAPAPAPTPAPAPAPTPEPGAGTEPGSTGGSNAGGGAGAAPPAATFSETAPAAEGAAAQSVAAAVAVSPTAVLGGGSGGVTASAGGLQTDPRAAGDIESLQARGDVIETDVKAALPEIAAVREEAFQQELNKLREEVQQEAVVETRVAASVFAVSTGLSVGYVLWLLRGGVLIASLLSSIPAWRLVDPLPVLGRVGGQDDEDDESLEEMVENSHDRDGAAGGDEAPRGIARFAQAFRRSTT